MKRVIIIAAVLALIFCGYWWALRQGLARAVTTAQTDMAAQGVTLSTPNIRYGGFPLSVKAVMDGPQISGPAGSVRAETLRLSASVFTPLTWTAQSEGDLRVDWRRSDDTRYLFDVIPSLMRAEFSAGLDGTLRAVTVTGFKLSATPVIGQAPPVRAVEQLRFRAHPDGDGTALSLVITDAFLDREAARDLQRAFGPHIKTLSLTGQAEGLRGLDKPQVDAWKTSGQFVISDSDIVWGDGAFQTLADVTLSERGGNGTATLKLRDAQALIDAMVSAEMITGNGVFAAQLALMAAPRDDQGLVVLTLPIKDGAVLLFGQIIYQL